MLPTHFQIFKNKYKKEEKHPDYKISFKNETTGAFEEIGAGWKKEMSNGEAYISCKLNVNPAPAPVTTSPSKKDDGFDGL